MWPARAPGAYQLRQLRAQLTVAVLLLHQLSVELGHDLQRADVARAQQLAASERVVHVAVIPDAVEFPIGNRVTGVERLGAGFV